MEDKIEVARESVSECINEIYDILEVYNCYMIIVDDNIVVREHEFGYEEEL